MNQSDLDKMKRQQKALEVALSIQQQRIADLERWVTDLSMKMGIVPSKEIYGDNIAPIRDER